MAVCSGVVSGGMFDESRAVEEDLVFLVFFWPIGSHEARQALFGSFLINDASQSFEDLVF